MLSTEDRLAIHELMALYGHIIDERQFSRARELFTSEVRYDVADFGAGVHDGPDAIRRLWEDVGAQHPLAHHATNVVITQQPDGTVQVVSKGIGVTTDGRAGTVIYRDVVVLTAQGWRIARRVAQRRRPETIPAPS